MPRIGWFRKWQFYSVKTVPWQPNWNNSMFESNLTVVSGSIDVFHRVLHSINRNLNRLQWFATKWRIKITFKFYTNEKKHNIIIAGSFWLQKIHSKISRSYYTAKLSRKFTFSSIFGALCPLSIQYRYYRWYRYCPLLHISKTE